MDDPIWEAYMHPSNLMQRCTKCGLQIFGPNTKAAYDWAEMAYHKAQQGGTSPETLRDKRLGHYRPTKSL